MDFTLKRHPQDSAMFEVTFKLNKNCTILAFIIPEDCLGEIAKEFNKLEAQASFQDDDITLNITMHSTGSRDILH